MLRHSVIGSHLNETSRTGTRAYLWKAVGILIDKATVMKAGCDANFMCADFI